LAHRLGLQRLTCPALADRKGGRAESMKSRFFSFPQSWANRRSHLDFVVVAVIEHRYGAEHDNDNDNDNDND
jgi:hypothetical protein